MKHIDSIIHQAMTSILGEQLNRDKYNPSSPTNPIYKDMDIYKKSKIGDYWPADFPRKKYSPNIETLFTKIGAKPVLVGDLDNPLTKKASANKGLANFEWKFADIQYRFRPNNSFITIPYESESEKKESRTLYWRYSDLPVRITNRNDDDYKTKEAALIAPVINYAPPAELVKLKKKHEDEYLIDVQLSRKGFGCFIISLKKGGPAEFTIYISESGQPAIIYATDAEAMKQKIKQKKNKEITRSVMDILGFVPILGDALDFVQALWYMYDFCSEEGEWSDLGYALLSLLAVIPIVGSFIKAGYKVGKAAFKTTKIIRKQKKQLASASRLTSADDVVELFEKTISNPSFTDTELAIIRKGLQITIGGFLKYAKRSRTFMKGNPAKLQRFDVAIQEIDQVYIRFSVSLDRVTDGLEAGIDLATGTIQPSFLQRMTSLITKGGVKKVKDLPKTDAENWKKFAAFVFKYGNPVKWIKMMFKTSIPEATARVVYRNIVDTFYKGLNNPEFLRVIFAASPNALRQEILRIARKHCAEVTSSTRTWDIFMDNIRSKGLRTTDVRFWDELSAIIPTANRPNFIQELGNLLIQQKHPVWLELLKDPITQIKNYFPRSAGQFASLVRGQLSNPIKHIRLIIDLFHDAAHDTHDTSGLFDEDPQSLAYQSLKAAIGDQYSKSMSNQFIQKMIVTPGVDGLTGTADFLGYGNVINKLKNNPTTPFDIPGHERGKEWVDPATKIVPINKSQKPTNVTKKKTNNTTTTKKTNNTTTTKKKPQPVPDRTGGNVAL